MSKECNCECTCKKSKKFKTGQTVKLKGLDGPSMLVQVVHTGLPGNSMQQIQCVWFSDTNTLCSNVFVPNLLERVSKDKEEGDVY